MHADGRRWRDREGVPVRRELRKRCHGALGTGADSSIQSHIVENALGIRSQGGNRADANGDDQRQHDGIFHSGRSVLRLQKPSQSSTPKIHDSPLSWFVTAPTNAVFPPRSSCCPQPSPGPPGLHGELDGINWVVPNLASCRPGIRLRVDVED